MMKRILFLITTIIYLSISISSGQSSSHFFTWTGFSKDRNWHEYFKELKEYGLDGILISSDVEGLKQIIPIAKEYGIEVHCWYWIMNNGYLANLHPEWLDYNADGISLKDSIAYVGYYRFLNPAIKDAREAIKEQVRKILEVDGLDGFSLDYCRYVDAILPKGLWKGYNIIQDKVYPKWDYGYHPEMIRQYREKYGKNPDIDDNDWLDFRCKILNDFVNELVEMVHSYGKIISASPFPTPKMSKQMVRQDWGKWHLDKAFPMIYHAFYEEDIPWVNTCIKYCIRDSWEKTEINYGLYVPDFQGDPSKLKEALYTAKKANAKGFSLYQFEYLNEKQKNIIKEVINNWE